MAPLGSDAGPGPASDSGTAGDPGPDALDVREALAAVEASALKLLAGFPRTPSTLRIQAGDVTIEAEWATAPAPVAAGSGAPPVPLVVAGGDDAGGAGSDEGSGLPAGTVPVCSPTVGTFYRSPEPGAAPFVEVGDTVNAGQQLAIVETMKLMIPVKADRAGTIVEVLKDDGEGVEHGEPLFAVGPGGPAG